MTLRYDLEIGPIIEAIRAAALPAELPRGDVAAFRRLSAEGEGEAVARAAGPSNEALFALQGLEVVDHLVEVVDGEILVRWYSPAGRSPDPGPAVVFLHGGGMIGGSVEGVEAAVTALVRSTGVPFLSVDYRLAPERTGTSLVEDGYAGLVWLLSRASEWGVDPARVAVMGESAGGGIAAGVAIAARDRGIPLARQILIYPMLDDRTTVTDPTYAPFVTWNWDNNYTGWHALLGDAVGTDDVDPLAAPARLVDFSKLADAYVEVGQLDVFCDEDIDYARRLAVAGVPVELHVHPGAPHGYEQIAPASDLAQRVQADRVRAVSAV